MTQIQSFISNKLSILDCDYNVLNNNKKKSFILKYFIHCIIQKQSLLHWYLIFKTFLSNYDQNNYIMIKLP